nr:uncharacterized protein CI109_004814 [Kwoniella shandongensis]KAA5526814.1 hypothetical protein CI109_004814 [Kwoniella shandongensis]
MPSTHPAWQQTYAMPASPSAAKQQQIRLASAQHSGNMFLNPVQEARILNWRQGASTATASTNIVSPTTANSSKQKTKKSKSAPASVQFSGSCSSGGGCGGGNQPCPTCASPPTTCSCSTARSPSSTKTKSKHSPRTADTSGKTKVKGYYSSKRKETSSGMSMTPTLPFMMTVRPKTPPPGRSKPKVRQPPQLNGSSSAAGWSQPPTLMHPPEREVAKPTDQPQIPRIAGARDPVSQN